MRLLLGALVGLMMLATPAFAHDWFKYKFVQTASEWATALTAQYSGPGGIGMYQYQTPPLREGEEWLDGKTINNADKDSCCNGADCWEIDQEEWWQRDGAYWVRRDGQTYAIPAGQAQPYESKKGKAAACIFGSPLQLRCFFVPLGY